jgi:predicted metalloprotease
MRWREGRRSENIEDRRGARVAGRPMAISGGGLLLLLVVTYALGGDPIQVLEMATGGGGAYQTDAEYGGESAGGAPTDEGGDFVSVVLADTEDTWSEIFRAAGKNYQPPRLVLFTDAVQSACGLNSAAVGPFYCPGDHKVYIDLGFYRDLREKFGAPGDFAQAYVIAHEVGHHVQNLLGISERVREQQGMGGVREANALSVKLELQADCFAGVWGHHAHAQRQLLEEGDVEEGLAAAAAIGDDRLQNMSRGQVNPESWTHGSSKQRVEWFRRGLESGDPGACETFE